MQLRLRSADTDLNPSILNSFWKFAVQNALLHCRLYFYLFCVQGAFRGADSVFSLKGESVSYT